MDVEATSEAELHCTRGYVRVRDLGPSVIAFGCATTSERKFRAGAGATIERVAEPDSIFLRRHGSEDTVIGLCNEMLDRAAGHRALEAFVLLAEDVALEDRGLPAKLRRLLATHADVGLIGTAGRGGTRDVTTLDGHFVVLASHAVRELRFDESLAVPLHCAVDDLSRTARVLGQRVIAADFRPTRSALCPRLGDRGRLVRGGVAVRRKWAKDLLPRSER
jgi:hypothetical protein